MPISKENLKNYKRKKENQNNPIVCKLYLSFKILPGPYGPYCKNICLLSINQCIYCIYIQPIYTIHNVCFSLDQFCNDAKCIAANQNTANLHTVL